MAYIRFSKPVKYGGKIYEPLTPLKVGEQEVDDLVSKGAKVISRDSVKKAPVQTAEKATAFGKADSAEKADLINSTRKVFEEMSLEDLHGYAKSNGINITGIKEKEAIIESILLSELG